MRKISIIILLLLLVSAVYAFYRHDNEKIKQSLVNKNQTSIPEETPPTSFQENPAPSNNAQHTVILSPKSPLGGTRLLSDDKCLSSKDIDQYAWGIRTASRTFLIAKGYSSSYFDQHFCAIGVSHNAGYARVTYKASFHPYLTWWQHHFPVVLSSNGQPLLKNGQAVIDDSGEKYILPELEAVMLGELLSPQKVYSLMQALIGSSESPITIHMGPGIGIQKLNLYAQATNVNPKSTKCSDEMISGIIDIKTGKGEISYSGSCQSAESDN